MQLSIRDLIKTGIHFGHKTSRWNPKMSQFIYGKKNGIHIINLKRTLTCLFRASKAIEKIVTAGGDILFVGTKRQAREATEKIALGCEMHYTKERWIGGTLTNHDTIMTRLQRLIELETWLTDGTINLYTKKERAQFNRELKRLTSNLGGIRHMTKLPSALVIIDPQREKNAVKEAKLIGIPTIALIDTDGDPSLIDFPVPGNDDSIKVINIFLTHIANAVKNGMVNRTAPMQKQDKNEIKSDANTTTSEPVENKS